MDKVFIIEDDINVLSGLEAKFGSLGMSVSANSGVEEACKIMRSIISFRPDYIILDFILPLTDAAMILHDIKSNEATYNIPVFIFSDISENDIKSQCRNWGDMYYFVKNDFSLDQFIEKVIKIIKNRKKKVKKRG